MCRAMIDRAQESNPGKTVFTKNELEEAHAKARKELGGAIPCPKSNSAMN